MKMSSNKKSKHATGVHRATPIMLKLLEEEKWDQTAGYKRSTPTTW